MLNKQEIISACRCFKEKFGMFPIIVGSAAMVMCGYQEHAADLDVHVNELIIGKMKKHGIKNKYDSEGKMLPYFNYYLNKTEFDVGPIIPAISESDLEITDDAIYLNKSGLLKFYMILDRPKDKTKIAFLKAL